MLAVPGDLATPTGGYAYARRVLEAAPEAGFSLGHLALPGGFPMPDAQALERASQQLTALSPDRPVVIDGLALGVLPVETLIECPAPVIALCHHPLALENGLSDAEAADLYTRERLALSATAAVIVTSRTTADILVRDYAVPPARLTVAHPGTDPAARAAGSGGAQCRLLSVGSLTPRKGHDRLISALAALREDDWSLTIAGGAHDSACAKALHDQIAAEGLTDRIRLAGALSSEALETAYHRADIFALASLYEGFGMAFAEAMARGLPTIGFKTGAVEEATRGAALLLDPGDQAGLTTALSELIRNPTRRSDLGERCWNAAQDFTRWSETTARIRDVVAGLQS